MRRIGLLSTVLILVSALLVWAWLGAQKENKALKQALQQMRAEKDALADRLKSATAIAQQIADRRDLHQRAQTQLQGQFVDRRAYFRQNWKQYITSSTNDYRTGALGGIKNLEIQIQNQSEFDLDNLVLEVSYIKNNGDLFKRRLIRSLH
jgi:Skp family chaperone for outer membrane proteins